MLRVGLMKRILFFSIAFAFSLSTAAQQGIFTFYSVNEGLAQSTVTCLFRDTSGYLWVGTGGGLSLFNGYEFRNYKSSINDSSSISNNRIRSFLLSSNGKNIWVGTEDGINCFSRKDVHLIKK
jgi:ligand-binding sensor domain-containing protein